MTPSQWAREREKMWRERFNDAAKDEDAGDAIRCLAKASEAEVFAAYLEDLERER